MLVDRSGKADVLTRGPGTTVKSAAEFDSTAVFSAPPGSASANTSVAAVVVISSELVSKVVKANKVTTLVLELVSAQLGIPVETVVLVLVAAPAPKLEVGSAFVRTTAVAALTVNTESSRDERICVIASLSLPTVKVKGMAGAAMNPVILAGVEAVVSSAGSLVDVFTLQDAVYNVVGIAVVQ